MIIMEMIITAVTNERYVLTTSKIKESAQYHKTSLPLCCLPRQPFREKMERVSRNLKDALEGQFENVEEMPQDAAESVGQRAHSHFAIASKHFLLGVMIRSK